MLEVYDNWKTLLKSQDKDNINLALSIAPSFDWALIETDILEAYCNYFLMYGFYYLQDKDISNFTDLAKENGVILPNKKDITNIWTQDIVFSVLHKIFELNPQLNTTQIYSDILLANHSIFYRFMQLNQHEEHNLDIWWAAFRKYYIQEQGGKQHLMLNGIKIPNAEHIFCSITDLTIYRYKFDAENIHLLYQMKNLKSLAFYSIYIDEKISLDLSRFPNLTDFVIMCNPKSLFNVENAAHLTKLHLENFTKEETEKWLAYTPNLKCLQFKRYKGRELPKNIIDLQQLELLFFHNTDKKINFKSLEKLPNLISLFLYYTNFEGFPLIKNLQILNIIDCNLDAIPFEIGKMENLKKLNLNYNRILFFKPFLIKFLLSHLELLCLTDAFINSKMGKKVLAISDEIKSNTKLELSI